MRTFVASVERTKQLLNQPQINIKYNKSYLVQGFYILNPIQKDKIMNQNQMLTDFKNYLINYIPKAFEDYAVYFSTYTFQGSNTRIKEESRKFFEMQTRRINNQITNSSDYNPLNSATQLYIPEYAPMNDRLHYHGLIFIPKYKVDEFNYKCVAFQGTEITHKIKIENNIIYKLGKRIYLSPYCSNPFIKTKQNNKSENNEISFDEFYKSCSPFQKVQKKIIPMMAVPKDISLKVDKYKITKLDSANDAICVIKYSSKNIFSKNYNHDGLILCMKDKKNKNDKYFAKKRKMVSGKY